VLRQAGPQGTGTVTSTPSNLPTAIQNKRPQPSTNEHKSGLSKGAKTGIITAVVLGVLTFTALGLYTFFGRKRSASAPLENASTPKEDERGPDTVMLDGASRLEADGKPIYIAELPETTRPVIAELSRDTEISELSAVSEDDFEKRRYI
jgi:hypothetical protein